MAARRVVWRHLTRRLSGRSVADRNLGLAHRAVVVRYEPILEIDSQAVFAYRLRDSDLDIVSTLNANEGSMEQAVPLLDLPEVSGMIYKDLQEEPQMIQS